jgi:ABC-2 type transport system ATP-binding protein
MKRRLNLAAAILHDPDLVLLDEPTVGVDPQSRNAIFDSLLSLKAAGKTIVYTTHYMEEAARLCDRVAVVDHGKPIALGTPRDLVASLGAEHVIEFTVEAVERLSADALHALPSVEGVRHEEGRFRLTVREVHRTVPALLSLLAEQGAAVSYLTTHHATLEDVFVSLTGRTLRDA